MKKIIFTFTLFLFILTLGGCFKSQNNEQTIKLRFDWIPTMSFAGDIVAMNNYAKQNNLKLILNPAGEGIDPIKMVLSGVDDIGIVGLDKMLLANEKGANLIAIGIVDNITPTVFMSKKDKNIISPTDFIGKKVGVQSGGATEFVYKTLIKKLNINEKEIIETQIGFDMKPFIENQYDVRPGFIFDEAVYLDINEIPYNLIEPKNYGLKYPGRVYFCKKDFLENNQDLIQRFINSVSKGWEFALSNPDSSISQLQKFEPKIDYNRELIGLKKAREYFSGFNGLILTPDKFAVEEMIQNLNELGILKNKPDFSTYFQINFINNYHKK